ncbi:MAG: efflux RND transporter periplasmic adaptor subunit [Candidatus Dependentiae bacterium]|jgi:HlyD family secretion protein
MRTKIILFILGLVAAGTTFYLQRRRPVGNSGLAHERSPLTTVTPTKSTIRHTVATSGMLQIKDSTRIGSLVAGTVKQILVKENDYVTKGQLLAVLDNGKDDNAILHAEGQLIRAQAQHDYLRAIHERQHALYEEGHISSQEYEEAYRNWQVSLGDLRSAQANLNLAKTEFENTRIKAPEDGIIIAVGIKKGVRVTTDLNATVLFETAQDVTQMEAELDIDEGDVCHIKKGHKVNFTVDSYPGRIFKGILSDISFSPTRSGNELVYRALLDVDNQKLLLRPGMTIHATIKVAKAKDALSLANQALYMEEDEVAAAAGLLGYECAPLGKAAKKQLCKGTDKSEGSGENSSATDLKYVWTVEGNKIAEKAIRIAARDDQKVEVRSGLCGEEACLIDIVQDDKMKKHYKNIFKGSL